MGLAYSVLASALWPMVAVVIPEYQLGKAPIIRNLSNNLDLSTILVTCLAEFLNLFIWRQKTAQTTAQTAQDSCRTAVDLALLKKNLILL